MSRTRLSGRKSPGFNRFRKVNSLGKFPVDAANYASTRTIALVVSCRSPQDAQRSAQTGRRLLWCNGAGEGIRTLDPDLGKVCCALFRDVPQDAGAFLSLDKKTRFCESSDPQHS